MGFKYEETMKKHVKYKATKKLHDHNFYVMLKENWKHSVKLALGFKFV